MYVHKGGDTYGFCPAKATWDPSNMDLYNILLIAAETGSLLYNGGIRDQPEWFVDLLAWFLPRHDTLKFSSKVEMVLGGESKNSSKPGPKKRRS